MRFPSDALHDLSGAAVRLTAIVNLLRDPETRADLDPARTDRDVREALERFRSLWEAHVNTSTLSNPRENSPEG